jgi:hypothetical protein
VEEVKPTIPTPAEKYVQLIGRDRFAIEAESKVVAETYMNYKVKDIVSDLITKYAKDVVSTQIESWTGSETVLEDVRFIYKPLKDCLDTLAKVAGGVYYCTPDMKFYFEQIKIIDSGIKLDDTLVVSPPNYTRSLIPLRNAIYLLGGKYYEVDKEVS